MKKDHIDVLHEPIVKALCHLSVPQRAHKKKIKPTKKSKRWNSSGFGK